MDFEDFERLESYYHLSFQIKEVKREENPSFKGHKKEKKTGLNISPVGNGKAKITRNDE